MIRARVEEELLSRGLAHRGDRLVSFFGSPAAFPIGPFVLAQLAGGGAVPALRQQAAPGQGLDDLLGLEADRFDPIENAPEE